MLTVFAGVCVFVACCHTQSLKDDTLPGGLFVPAGAAVNYHPVRDSPLVTAPHRHRMQWELIARVAHVLCSTCMADRRKFGVKT